MENWTTLEFTSLDPCRTFLVDRDRKVLYTIKTDEPPNARPVTNYTDAFDHTFASLEWRMFLPDKLRLLPDGEKNVVNKWLIKEKNRSDSNKKKQTEISFEFRDKRYYWKGFEEGEALQFYTGKEHIASYAPPVHSKKMGIPPVDFAQVRLSPRLSDSKDVRNLAMLSLLIILKARRFGGTVRITL